MKPSLLTDLSLKPERGPWWDRDDTINLIVGCVAVLLFLAAVWWSTRVEGQQSTVNGQRSEAGSAGALKEVGR